MPYKEVLENDTSKQFLLLSVYIWNKHFFYLQKVYLNLPRKMHRRGGFPAKKILKLVWVRSGSNSRSGAGLAVTIISSKYPRQVSRPEWKKLTTKAKQNKLNILTNFLRNWITYTVLYGSGIFSYYEKETFSHTYMIHNLIWSYKWNLF